MLGILLGDGRSEGGVEIVGVTPGGGAEAAGLEAGDLIVKIGDADLAAAESPMRGLVQFMRDVEAGDVVPVVYEREGESVTVDITTQARGVHVLKILDSTADLDIDLSGLEALANIPNMPKIQKEIMMRMPSQDWLLEVEGDLASYFDVAEGVVVVRAPDASELKGGDVLLVVDGASVEDAEQAVQALAGIEGSADVRIKRKGRERTVEVEEGTVSKPTMERRQVIRIKRKEGDDDEETVVEIVD